MRQNGAEPPAPTPEEGDGRGSPAAPGPRLTPSRRDKVLVAVLVGGVLLLAASRGAITAAVVVLLAVLIPSVILHEVSHGAVALLFGDDTAKRAGRLTLNPINHIDPVGTVILPALLILFTGVGFGYAKPVPVNPARMRDPRNHSLLVSLAGPAVNIVLAVAAALAARSLLSPLEIDLAARAPDAVPFLTAALVYFGLLNAILAAFNLIPLPPLDGSAVVERLLPRRLWPAYIRIRPYSMLLILVGVFVLPGGFGFVFSPAILLWESLAL